MKKKDQIITFFKNISIFESLEIYECIVNVLCYLCANDFHFTRIFIKPEYFIT